jgi:hypothetical protein
VKLSNHFHLVPKLRMRGTIPPLPHARSWRSAMSYTFTVMLYTMFKENLPYGRTVTNMQTSSRLPYHKELRGKPSTSPGSAVLTWNKRNPTFVYMLITFLVNYVMIHRKSSDVHEFVFKPSLSLYEGRTQVEYARDCAQLYQSHSSFPDDSKFRSTSY